MSFTLVALPEFNVDHQDNPSAEPRGDVQAQMTDLQNPDHPRAGVFLSQEALSHAGDVANGGFPLANFDGKGGTLVAKDRQTARHAVRARNGGVPMQEILGTLTGAGKGKPANGNAVVQQLDTQGNVTRETLVNDAQHEQTASDFASEGRDVRILSPDQAIQRRAEGVAADQAQANPAPHEAGSSNIPATDESESPTFTLVSLGATDQGGVVPSLDTTGLRSNPAKIDQGHDIALAADRVNTEPTPKQAQAGNYQMGHVKINGLDITIENPKGSIRRGVDPDGKPWESQLPGHYGYIKSVQGNDGDHLDILLGDKPNRKSYFVIDQQDPDSKKFDEHKVVGGVDTREEAAALYASAYSDGSGAGRIRSITEMPVEEFKAWAKSADKSKPAIHAKNGKDVAEAAAQASVKPWEMDWSGQKPLATAPEGNMQNPWEMDWSGKQGSQGPLADAQAAVSAQAAAQLGAPSQGKVESNIADKRDISGDDPYHGLGNPYSPIVQGATFDAADEITSGMMTPFVMATNAVTGKGPTAPSDVYTEQKAIYDRDKALYEKEHPVKAVAGELFGSLISGGKGVNLVAKAPTMVGKVLRSAAVGGGIGGAQGFFGADGTVADRVKGAEYGAESGAVLGAALPPVFAVSKALAKGLIAPIRSLANKETFAAGKVAESLARDKLTPERVAKRLVSNSAVKGDLAVADVSGSNTSDLLRAASNVPSNARQGLVQQLEYRHQKQLSRLQDDIGGAFGDAKMFHTTAEKIVNERKAAAKPLFERAFNTATPYTVDLQNVLDRPLTRQLVERAKIAAANRGEKFSQFFIPKASLGDLNDSHRVIDTEGLHRVKMILDESINGMKRGQETGLKNANVRDLTILKKDLLGAMDNPAYKSALRRYAGDSAVASALDDGFENGLKMDPEAITTTLANLSPTEQKMWRLGFSRSISDSLRDTGRAGANRADVLMAPKYMQRLNAAIPDAKSRLHLGRAINLEQRMARTRNAVGGNSTTARQLAQGQEAGVAAQDAHDILSAGKNLATGDFLGAAVKFLSRAKNTATGLRPEVADTIIKLLTAKTPQTLRRAQILIDRQTAKQNTSVTRSHMLDSLRAISAGLFGGHLANYATNR